MGAKRRKRADASHVFKQRGGIPQGSPRYRAIPASRDQSLWTAALLIPSDHKGPLPLSVYVLKHAGLESFDTIIVEVTEP